MSWDMPDASGFATLKRFFEKPACQRATAPLRKGIEISVIVDSETPATLRRTESAMQVLASTSENPDMTFRVPLGALEKLANDPTDDIGEIGIAIIKAMIDGDDRITAKVHIGPFDLLLRGYLSVLPLGGPGVMKFLASKGFTGISKIKEGIARMKD